MQLIEDEIEISILNVTFYGTVIVRQMGTRNIKIYLQEFIYEFKWLHGSIHDNDLRASLLIDLVWFMH